MATKPGVRTPSLATRSGGKNRVVLVKLTYDS